MTIFKKLQSLRQKTGQAKALGLDDATIHKFLATDPKLALAIESAEQAFEQLTSNERELLKKPEHELYLELQKDFLNFYAREVVQPFVALASSGPWIVTAYGSVIYDCGGYGMLGSGHNPESVVQALSQRYVMANIMTPSFSQKRFCDRLNHAIGTTRRTTKADSKLKFVCLNSGSEAMSLALRISDANAFTKTKAGGPHAGKKIKLMAITGSFHGRTERPSQVSGSCLKNYKENLATFQNHDDVIFVEQNNISDFKTKWQAAIADQIFIEAMVVEPVMGEGQPGCALSPEFYKIIREQTAAQGSLLIVDSIQAGLRAHGYLSIADYPGFQDFDPPDIESFSKALNAGQFPLSVLALNPKIAATYKTGLYGNTMTSNPRALEVAITVLDHFTVELRQNIVARGHEFVEKLKELDRKLGGLFTRIDGTGLLIGAHLNPDRFKVVGDTGLEMHMRLNGVNVIHGGKNALRFTPHFAITSAEVALVVEHVEMALKDALAKK